MREGSPEKVMLEPSMIDVKKKVMGRSEGNNSYTEGIGKVSRENQNFRWASSVLRGVSVSHRAELLNLSPIYILSQFLFVWGISLFTVRCLAASLASTHQISVVSLQLRIKNVSKYCRTFPGVGG